MGADRITEIVSPDLATGGGRFGGRSAFDGLSSSPWKTTGKNSEFPKSTRTSERDNLGLGCQNIVSEGANAYYSQRIGAGYMDTSRKELTGQMIGIDNVPSGQYWLEVEVNPDHTVVERDNNLFRVVITIP